MLVAICNDLQHYILCCNNVKFLRVLNIETCYVMNIALPFMRMCCRERPQQTKKTTILQHDTVTIINPHSQCQHHINLFFVSIHTYTHESDGSVFCENGSCTGSRVLHWMGCYDRRILYQFLSVAVPYCTYIDHNKQTKKFGGTVPLNYYGKAYIV